jgi:hypothetical protein
LVPAAAAAAAAAAEDVASSALRLVPRPRPDIAAAKPCYVLESSWQAAG